MNETKESSVNSVVAMAQLVVSDLPKCHLDYDRRMWKAFEYGREYERAIESKDKSVKTTEKK